MCCGVAKCQYSEVILAHIDYIQEAYVMERAALVRSLELLSIRKTAQERVMNFTYTHPAIGRMAMEEPHPVQH